MPRILMSFLALLLLISAGAAQAPVDDTAATIKELKQQLLKMQEQLDALEAAQQKTAQTPQPQSAAVAAESAISQPSLAPSMAGMQTESLSGPKLRMRGYADMGYSATDAKGTTNTFALGQFNLFITSQLSSRTSMLAEAVIESDTDNAFGIELERLLLKHSVSDYLNFYIGRYHSAIGFYNTAYHHSAYMQTAIGRPLMFQFEDSGGILPIHNVGVSVDGMIPSGSLGLHYVADVGNGRTSLQGVGEPVQNRVDENNGKSVNFALYATPLEIPGFRVGVSFYHDHLTPTGLPNMGEFIYSAHVIYQKSNFEFLNEAAVIRHTPDALTSLHLHTPAAYTQISQAFGDLRPYFRFDYINPSGRDPILGPRGRQSGPSAGLRYDFDPAAAFKIQYSRLTQNGLAANGIAFQVAFAF